MCSVHVWLHPHISCRCCHSCVPSIRYFNKDITSWMRSTPTWKNWLHRWEQRNADWWFLMCLLKNAQPYRTEVNWRLLFFCSLQLDQLVIDSAMEKREMEHKHALIQQRVRQLLYVVLLLLLYLQSLCHKIRASILYCSILVRLCKSKFSAHPWSFDIHDVKES